MQARGAGWEAGALTTLIVADAIAIWVALVLAAVGRFGLDANAQSIRGISYGSIVALIAAGWLLTLGSAGAYEARVLGTGPLEYKRVVTGTLAAFGILAIISYAIKFDMARGFVAIALPLGVALLVAERYLMRQQLVRRRMRGEAMTRVLVLGDEWRAVRLADQLARAPEAGYRVVGMSSLDSDRILQDLRHHQAGALAIVSSESGSPERLRQISWQLEGTGVDLIVAPSLTDVAGPRLLMHPVAGLPLLHVDPAEFTGVRRIAKNGLDKVFALLLLVLASPVLLVAAIAIKLTSRGPVLFRQKRVGIHGELFEVYKLRSMVVDAEARLPDLRELDEGNGVLFKVRDDPRVTPVGRFLRRFSIDELPQLLNVLRGQMSLVGPRPPLPVEVDKYGHDVRRRLLVRPGITGLWQVSGRSDLSWEESVRLDLYYVENWSITLDLLIMVRTLAVVLRRRGAY